MRQLQRIAIFGTALSRGVLFALPSSAQIPQSVICSFEKIATVAQDSPERITAATDTDEGEMVLSNLRSDTPSGSGNLGAGTLRVLKRSSDALWLADITSSEVAGFITLFFRTGIVMYTKHEILHTLSGEEKPFGFVEIGRCRPLK